MQHTVVALSVFHTLLKVSATLHRIGWQRDCYISGCNFSAALKATVKPVLSGHLKRDRIKVLMENGSLMKVESIAECSLLEHSAILLTCIKR